MIWSELPFISQWFADMNYQNFQTYDILAALLWIPVEVSLVG